MTFEIEEGPITTDDAKPVGEPVLNLELYRPYLADVEVSQEDKDEFLRAMFYIFCSFARVGKGLDSVQSLFPFLAENPSPPNRGAVNCEEQPCALTFASAVSGGAGKEGS
jgi:hypothetical protein